jgi:hypothetical protein
MLEREFEIPRRKVESCKGWEAFYLNPTLEEAKCLAKLGTPPLILFWDPAGGAKWLFEQLVKVNVRLLWS